MPQSEQPLPIHKELLPKLDQHFKILILLFFFIQQPWLLTTSAQEETVHTLPKNCEETVNVVGDFGTTSSTARRVSEAIAASGVECVYTVGDNVYGNHTYETAVRAFYDFFINNQRFFPIPGNHDHNEPNAGIENYRETFPYMPYLDDAENGHFFMDGDTYSVIGVDTHVINGGSNEEERAAYLERMTALAKTTTSDVVLFFLHNPPYSSGEKHGSDDDFQWNFAEIVADREDGSSALPIIIAGDDHNAQIIVKDGVHYLISGHGARASSPITEPPLEGLVWGAADHAGYMQLTFSSEKRTIDVKFLDENNQVRYTHSIENPYAVTPQTTVYLPLIRRK